ncbi:MAG: hypothetical protein P1R58_00535, partial [bacterium]|nr:hypothetical protein [bacterium]
VEEINRAAAKLSPKSIIVAAWWQPQIQVTAANSEESPLCVYLLDSTMLKQAKADSITVYYLPEVLGFNQQIHGIDLSEEGLVPLL